MAEEKRTEKSPAKAQSGSRAHPSSPDVLRPQWGKDAYYTVFYIGFFLVLLVIAAFGLLAEK